MTSEKTLHEFRPSWGGWFWTIILSFGLLIPWAWWRRRGVRYEVTENRVLRYTGRLSKRTEEIALADVSRIRTGKSFGEQALDAGTITIDTGQDELTMSAVPNHDSVVETIRENS